MDMNTLTPDTIAQTLNINVSTQENLKANQALFNQYKALPSFGCFLLEICCNLAGKYPMEIELNAAIQLKNFINSNWRFTNNHTVNKSLVFDDEEEKIIIIRDSDKEYIRTNILDAVIHSIENDKGKVLKQLNQSVKKIVKLDFKDMWRSQYFSKVLDCFKSNNQKRVYAGIVLLHQVSKIYEFEDKDEIQLFNEEFLKVNDLLLNVLNECQELNNPIQAQFVYKIFKVFKKNFQGNTPPCVTEAKNYFLWSSQLERIIKTPLDQPSYPKASVFWKLKCVAYQTLLRIYSKYADKTGNDVTEFQVQLIDKYTPYYFSLIKTIFINESHHAVYIDDTCMSCILAFFSYLIRNRTIPEEVLKLFEDNKAKELLIKSAMLGKEDLDIWFNEPKSYINKQIEEMSWCFTKRYSAFRISDALMMYKKPNTAHPAMFDQLFQYYVTMLQLNEEGLAKENEALRAQTEPVFSLDKLHHNLIKESIMYLIGLSHSVVIYNAKNVLDEFIGKYIVPELHSPFGVLREKVCLFLRNFEKYQYANQGLVSIIIPQVCKLLQNDTNLPVKVFSALVAASLLKQPSTKILLQGNVKSLLGIYITLMEETDLEEIVNSIQKVVKEFTQESTEFIIQLIDYLIKYFTKLTKRESDEEKMQETSFLIGNLISTFVNIIHYFANNEMIYPQLEKYIEVLLAYCFNNDLSDKQGEGLDILSEIAETKHSIPLKLWNYFKQMICSVAGSDEELKEFKDKYPNNIFEGVGFDLVDDITNVVCLMISKDPETFIKGTDDKGVPYLTLTFRLVKSIIEICEGTQKFDMIYCAVNILNVLFDTFKGKIDSIWLEILKFISAKMGKTNTDYKRQIKLLIADCFLYNPLAFINYYQSVNELEKVFAYWADQMSALKNKKQLHHHLIAFTTLISIDPSKQNPLVTANMKQIIEMIISIAKRLNDIKEKGEEGDEEFEEVNDAEDGDEAKEKYEKLLIGDFDDNRDESIDSMLNAVNFNDLEITSIDKLNEICFLRDSLKTLSETNREYYAFLQALIGEKISELKEIILKEEKRIAERKAKG